MEALPLLFFIYYPAENRKFLDSIHFVNLAEISIDFYVLISSQDEDNLSLLRDAENRILRKIFDPSRLVGLQPN